MDHWRMSYHLEPPFGWMNDPNGLVEFGGKYHAFYQLHPFSPFDGPKHWGHAISGDLMRWDHMPIAIAPDPAYETGCYSGSAVDNGGELTLIYTSHNEGGDPLETQSLAFSRDGMVFTKYEGNPVITQPPTASKDFRDPKVIFADGAWHLIAGTRDGEHGCVVMYDSPDLRQWTYRGIICRSDGTQGDMWECPDLFPLGDKHVLMCSPMNMEGVKTLFIVGHMDYEKAVFTQEYCHEVDLGHEFYAPQTLLDGRGRRIMISWMEMWGNDMPTQALGRAGALTLPRELSLGADGVYQRPVAEAETLRTTTLFSGKQVLQPGKQGLLRGKTATRLELCLNMKRQGHGRVAAALRASADLAQHTLIIYDFENETLTVDTSRSGEGRRGVKTIAAPPMGDSVDIRAFVDGSSLEVFAMGGRYALSQRIYPDFDSVHMDVWAEGADVEAEIGVYALE